jgi:uncharacterized coiled-coil protein SlyX
MNDHNVRNLESPRKIAGLWPQFIIGAIGVGVALAGLPAQASESQTPWECSSYTGAAHTRCLEAFVESQRDQIATLQGKMQAQQETVNHMKDQIDRQASASADLQRQVAQPPAVVQVIPPLYAYPPVGLGLYLGRPWVYGPPYYFYRPYVYGPRYYGYPHRGHRW